MTLGAKRREVPPLLQLRSPSQPHFTCFLTQLSLTLACLSDSASVQLFVFLLASFISVSRFPIQPSFSFPSVPEQVPPECWQRSACSSSSFTSLISFFLFLCCFRSSTLCISVFALRLDPAPTASAMTPGAGTGPAVPPARCSRTFITFSDDATFEEWFPQGRPPKVPVREVCPVTHRPALYRDPVTDIPYATARAFKIIREAYKKYITAHGLPPTASALGPGPPPPEPLPGSGPRALRQKIVIK